MIEILDQSASSPRRNARLVHRIEPLSEIPTDQSLAAIAYASFFTEAEQEEIGTFDELPAPERARWQSVAAHIARTVVSPVDEDIEAWRAEQRTVLAEQVREAPYSRELWRAMTRTTDMQQQIASLRDLLVASRASIATARSHSQRLATSTQALEYPIWSVQPVTDVPDADRADAPSDAPADAMTGSAPRLDHRHPDGSAQHHDLVIRRT